jgi:DMSO/TMAO reductase YedYZ molybdopterin-dependent catalytic subunit
MEYRPKAATGALAGLLLTAPLIAIFYLAGQIAGLPFVPFDLFDGVTRVLPGPVTTFGIDLMIDTLRALNVGVSDTAKTAEQSIAVAMALAAGVLFGAVYFAILRRQEDRPALIPGLILGAVQGVPALIVNLLIGQSSIAPALRGLWVLVAFLGWGVAFGWVYNRLRSLPPASKAETGEALTVRQLDRRRFLIQVGAATAAITVVGAGVGINLATSGRRRREAAVEAGASRPLPNADDPVVPAPGTRPEYTPIADHYQVFIRTTPSVIDGAAWTLPISGLVDNPLTLTLDDLRSNYQPMDQYITLSCISGRLATGLIGTTLWTGVSLQDVLADAGVQPGAKYLNIQSADGFHETLALDLIDSDRRIMLTYAWDEKPLPTENGFPLRVYIPDRYGMKQPKWITAIEVTDEYHEGYWVERGWDEVARMNTVSVIDTVADDAIVDEGDRMLVPIGGMAHAGARGVSKVEVRVDGGEWVEAQLRAPLSETTWVIWRYDWPFEAGEHVFEVRCAEADGTPQIEQFSDARPSGTTGIHSVEESL